MFAWSALRHRPAHARAALKCHLGPPRSHIMTQRVRAARSGSDRAAPHRPAPRIGGVRAPVIGGADVPAVPGAEGVGDLLVCSGHAVAASSRESTPATCAPGRRAARLLAPGTPPRRARIARGAAWAGCRRCERAACARSACTGCGLRGVPLGRGAAGVSVPPARGRLARGAACTGCGLRGGGGQRGRCGSCCSRFAPRRLHPIWVNHEGSSIGLT